MKSFDVAAASLVALSSVTASAQQSRSLTHTMPNLSVFELKECYKRADINLVVQKESQTKVEHKGISLGLAAALYANASTGSYTIVLEAEDERALNRMEGEELDRRRKDGTINDFYYSCVMGSASAGYPGNIMADPTYKLLFGPK